MEEQIFTFNKDFFNKKETNEYLLILKDSLNMSYKIFKKAGINSINAENEALKNKN
ncbi:MAG: hypothetical protein ACYDDE_00695 [bacterium]